jgi:hypothetical protein
MCAELLAVRGIENTSELFRKNLFPMAQRLGANPNWLAAVMSFESAGSFDPAKKNPASSATGLIQFMEYTAKNLGTTTAELAAMSDAEQLKWVEKYLRPVKGRLRTVSDHYMAVFAPIGIGKPLGFKLYKGEGNPAYERNKGLDWNKDFAITVAEASAPIFGIIGAAEKRPRIAVDTTRTTRPPDRRPLEQRPGEVMTPGRSVFWNETIWKAAGVASTAAAAYAAARWAEGQKKPKGKK